MKHVLKLGILIFLFTNSLFAQNLENFRNNKELISRKIFRQDLSKLNYWINQHFLEENELARRAKEALGLTVLSEENSLNWCELGFIKKLKENAQMLSVIQHNEDIYNLLRLLRNKNIIDDLFYQILKDSAQIHLEFQTSTDENLKKRNPIISNDENLTKVFKSFQLWPNEIQSCTLNTYRDFLSDVKKNYNRNDFKFISQILFVALKKGVIDQTSFQKIQILKNLGAGDWDLYLNKYVKIIRQVKDKSTTNPEEKPESSFSDTYVYRRSSLTRRERLYSSFDRNQIILMSQLIEKTAKRMDAKEVHLYFQFDEANTENEIYIFSPMEQYRVALKLLRKDMAQLRRSETFVNTEVQYEDIIASAYETGIITSKELDHVLGFDDLWNPKVSKWRGLANFTLNIAGTAAFFLPAPWNYISAIGLIFTQTAIAGGQRNTNPEDNENVII